MREVPRWETIGDPVFPDARTLSQVSCADCGCSGDCGAPLVIARRPWKTRPYAVAPPQLVCAWCANRKDLLP